jgi:hypothetical protein
VSRTSSVRSSSKCATSRFSSQSGSRSERSLADSHVVRLVAASFEEVELPVGHGTILLAVPKSRPTPSVSGTGGLRVVPTMHVRYVGCEPIGGKLPRSR